jgi:hypothetical protein
MQANGSALNGEDASHVVDFASGLVYTHPSGMEQVPVLRQAALGLGGYAIVTLPNGESDDGGDLDLWGYTSETLSLMGRLKERWDPSNCLNPDMFLV